VDLVATDGFLYPNRVLEERGLMKRKGFRESYDLRRMVDFLAAVKRLNRRLLPRSVRHPDVLVFEGLNVVMV
jgi:type I pantothenate kinase